MGFVLNAIQSYCNHETALKILRYLCIGNLISHRKPVSDWNVYKKHDPHIPTVSSGILDTAETC